MNKPRAPHGEGDPHVLLGRIVDAATDLAHLVTRKASLSESATNAPSGLLDALKKSKHALDYADHIIGEVVEIHPNLSRKEWLIRMGEARYAFLTAAPGTFEATPIDLNPTVATPSEKRTMEVQTGILPCRHGVVGYCEQCALQDPYELGEKKPRLASASATAPSQTEILYIIDKEAKAWEAQNMTIVANAIHAVRVTVMLLFKGHTLTPRPEERDIRPAATRVLEMLEAEGYGSTEPTDALRSALECRECPTGDCDDCPRKPARWVPQS